MRLRLRHLPEKADQCLGCACENSENLAARELLLATGAVTVRGVIAALYIGGTEHDQIVALAREAISEQREWCERNGAFKPVRCPRQTASACPIPAGEAPVMRVEE